MLKGMGSGMATAASQKGKVEFKVESNDAPSPKARDSRDCKARLIITHHKEVSKQYLVL